MSNSDRVLEFLISIAPLDASNSEIVSRTMIKPHQQVFQLTQNLMKQGRISGRLFGREWRFSAALAPKGLQSENAVQPAREIASTFQPGVEYVSVNPASTDNFSEAEIAYFRRLSRKDEALRAILRSNFLPEKPDVLRHFHYLNGIKDTLGNISNDLGFLATLLAKQYLAKRFAISFDAAEKAQGAPGPDIDVVTPGGKRIVCELKTTKPYQKGFGAQQKKEMWKDLHKLRDCGADYKFMMVTNGDAFSSLCNKVYAIRADGIEIVDLIGGRTFKH
jgi:hypothetical protein